MNKDLILYIFGVVINVALIVLVFASLDPSGLDVYFNSDTLYLPSVYRDLFLDKSGICGWHFNPAPNFFPDMLVYFIIRFVSGNFINAAFVYSLLQYFSFTFLVWLLNKALHGKPDYLSLSVVNILISLVFLVSLINSDVVFTAYFLLNSYHMGAFIMALIGYNLSFRFLQNNRKKYLFWIAIVIFPGIISDKLLIVLYVLPTLLWIVFPVFSFYKKGVIRLVILVVSITCLSLAGSWLLKQLSCFTIGTPNQMLGFRNIPDAFGIFLNQTTTYLTEFSIKTIIVGITASAFFISLGWMIRERKKQGWVQEQDRDNRQIMVFHFLLCTFIPIVLFAPVINGNYTGFDSLRYNIYAYYFGLIGLGFLIKTTEFKWIRIVRYGSILWIFLMVIIILVKAGKMKETRLMNFFSYYPESARIIDSLAVEKDLEYGLANYWDAKLITMFSKQDVRVYAVFDDLTPYYHVTNSNWFYGGRGRYDQPVFTFILTKSFSGLQQIPSRIMVHSKQFRTQGVSILELPGLKYQKGSFKPHLIDVPGIE